MQSRHVITSAYHCRRVKPDGPIQILNDHSYVMAEYNQTTGVMSWKRVVLAAQRANIEQWVAEQYPVTPRKRAAHAA